VVLAENMPAAFDTEALIRGASAVLIIVPADDAAPRLDYADDTADVLVKPTLPVLRVRPAAIARWLESAGYAVADLERFATDLQPAEGEPDATARAWATLELPLRVRARVELSAPQVITGYNVLGILPGNDLAMDEQALQVSTGYDLPEPTAGHTIVSASDGPAGAGIVLEIVRLWQAEVFKPRRAVLLCFWAGGHLSTDGSATYLQERTPYRSLQVDGALHLGNVSGSGQALIAQGEDSATLKSLLERSAQVLSVPLADAGDTVAPRAGAVVVRWAGAPDAYAGADTVERLASEQLAQVGQVVNLALITASRQYHY
jgi:hypothetical protein